MDRVPMTELYAALVDWALSQGARDIDALPGLWAGETHEWRVEMNGHRREINGVAPYGYRLRHKTALVGIAVGNPFGGVVAGPSEGDLINHFRAATPSSARLN